jgi:hypothetical protein
MTPLTDGRVLRQTGKRKGGRRQIYPLSLMAVGDAFICGSAPRPYSDRPGPGGEVSSVRTIAGIAHRAKKGHFTTTAINDGTGNYLVKRTA